MTLFLRQKPFPPEYSKMPFFIEKIRFIFDFTKVNKKNESNKYFKKNFII